MFKNFVNGKKPHVETHMDRPIGIHNQPSCKWVPEPVSFDETGFTFADGLSIYVVTWNVCGKSPNDADLTLLLSACERPPDVYAVGLQDVPKTADSQPNDDWIKAIMKALHPRSKYSVVQCVQLGSTMLVVIVRNCLLASGILCSQSTVGKAYSRTRRAVGVSLLLRSVNICFVCVHFIPHEDCIWPGQTNLDYINEMMHFKYRNSRRRIDGHDAVFFFGELNYGLLPRTGEPSPTDYHWSSKIKYDKLRSDMALGHTFAGYAESKINFAPTTSGGKAGELAWNGRILWRGVRVKPMGYRSVMNIPLSDHHPVYGLFDIQNELMGPVNKGQNRVTLLQNAVYFPVIKFGVEFKETFTITNSQTMHVTVRFSLKQESSEFHENWLTVEPAEVTIEPGKCRNIGLRVRIDSTNVCVVQAKTEIGKLLRVKLGHVVLQQVNEEDQLITVFGTYATSVFGHTMETLAHMNSNQLIPSVPSPWEPQPKTIHFMTDTLVPLVLIKLGTCLCDHGLLLPNLFVNRENQRIYRDHPDIQTIQQCLEMDVNGPLEANPHAVAEVFMMLLESAPKPLVDSVDVELNCTRPVVLRDVVARMSAINRAVFLYVLHILISYINHRSYNKCDIGRLAILFGEILMKEHPCKIDKCRAGPIHDDHRSMFFVQILSTNYAQLFFDVD